MANGIVRLERFFSSKRKPSSTPSSTEPSSPVTPSEPQFPSPSFIRPKASRMTARKETYLKQAHRTNTNPNRDLSNARSAKKSDITTPAVTDSAPQLPMVVRSSSFDESRCDSLFNVYDFPAPPSDSADQLPLLERVDLESIFDGFTSDSSDSTTASPSQAPAPTNFNESTKLGGEAVNIQSLVDSLNKKLPAIPRKAIMPKEEAGPAADWDLKDPAAVNIIDTYLCEDIERQLGEVIPKEPLQSSGSESTLSPASWRDSLSSCPSSVLWEPDFSDFMTLSDDDIAESSPGPSSVRSSPRGELPPTPPLTASTIEKPAVSRPRSLLTLTPPFACKPAAAAAYEAARIARRYEFDLVYVVSLWPDSTRPRTPSIGRQESSRSNSRSSYHMTGRLLAAYGLERAKSPFRITTSAHAQVLRSEDWIEYRSQQAWRDEFAQGYACSFFTGQNSRSNSVASNLSSSTQMSKKRMDRGLVFAAYRNPKEDGTMRCSDEKELKAIKRDAEGLAEMLMDIYAAHRLRQAPLFTQLQETDSTAVTDVKLT